jgi:hypothetical protein
MANTDFFDDDLIKQRDAAKRIKLGPGDDPMGTVGDGPSSDEVPVRPVSDFNLTRMAKHRHEVDDQVVHAMQELERLRKRQEDLEREKQDLEDLRRRQDEYERGKREMVERFNQSLVSLEKDELQAERMAELLGATRKRFKTMLAELQAINEELWGEEHIREELNKALIVLEDGRMEYNKAMSKIDAVSGGKKSGVGEHEPVVFEEGRPVHETEKSFGHWVKVGLAVTLPIIVVLVAITVVFFILRSTALI